VANVVGVVIGAVIIAVTGNTDEIVDGDLSIGMVAILQLPLWIGYLGAPLWAGRARGNGVVADFGLRMRGRDVPIGLGAGIATQIVVIPLLYVALFALFDAIGLDTDRDISEAARELVDKATDPVGVVLLVLVTVVGAPIVEELFFRGLLLRAIQKRFGARWALWGSSVVFAAVHLQLLQFPALVVIGLVLGWLTLRYDRLGPAIWAHVAFNAVATIALLAD